MANPPVEGALAQRSQDYNAWWNQPYFFPSFFLEKGNLEAPMVPGFVHGQSYTFRVHLPGARKCSVITMTGGPLQATQDLRKDGKYFVGEWSCKAYSGTRIILGTDKVTPQGMQYDVFVEWMVGEGMAEILKDLPLQAGLSSSGVYSVGRNGSPAPSGYSAAPVVQQQQQQQQPLQQQHVHMGYNSAPAAGGYNAAGSPGAPSGGYPPSAQPPASYQAPPMAASGGYNAGEYSVGRPGGGYNAPGLNSSNGSYDAGGYNAGSHAPPQQFGDPNGAYANPYGGAPPPNQGYGSGGYGNGNGSGHATPPPTGSGRASPDTERLRLEKEKQAKEKQMERHGTGAILGAASMISPTFRYGLMGYGVGKGMHNTKKDLDEIDRIEAQQKQQQAQQQQQQYQQHQQQPPPPPQYQQQQQPPPQY